MARSRILCPHNRERYRCVPCGGVHICPHHRRRSQCRFCLQRPRSQAMCPCGRGTRRAYCVPCGGSGICQHSRKREQCAECDPVGHVKARARKVTARAFRGLRRAKPAHTGVLLGCSFPHFAAHIQRKIEHWNATHAEQISLDDCHFDHIKPLNRALLDGSDIRELTHYTNIQPIPCRLNLVKSNHWSPADDARWRRDVRFREGHDAIFWPDAYPAVEMPGAEWAPLWLLATVSCKLLV